MIRNISFIFTFLNLVAGNIKGQETSLPFLSEVSFKVVTRLDLSTGIYSYTYAIRNGVNNVGKIISIEIDISRDSSAVQLSDSGLQFKSAGLQDAYRRALVNLGSQIIPVSFPSLPTFCDAGVTVRKTVDFFRPLIGQGREIMGYVITSRGLPKIRRFAVSPRFEIDEYYPKPDEVSNADSLARRIDSDREVVKFHGFTIGPGAPPAEFHREIWIDTLLSYARQSAELGWLGRDRDNDCDTDEKPEDGIVRNIEQRLNKAKRQLERKDSVLARRELEKLVAKVERLWKRSQDDDKKDKREGWEKKDKVVMTSEAYALLKYNTEYLIDRLPDRKPKKGSKDKD